MHGVTLDDARRVCAWHNLPEPHSLERIAIGFTNEVYSLDDLYILKVCSDPGNEEAFAREAALYGVFRNRLPVPQIIAFDPRRELLSHPYILYPRIPGDNLYAVWHRYPEGLRRSIVSELCSMLRKIAETPQSEWGGSVQRADSWKETVLQRIHSSMDKCEAAGSLGTEEVAKIRHYCAEHANCLDEQRMALVYWDAHFDNVLVQDGSIVGLLDFERTEVASIDFMLDVVKRMVEFPGKYMSEQSEKYARKEDYAHLIAWYRECYPELFAFRFLERRLDLYALAHDLADLENWAHVPSLMANIMRTVNGNH